MQYRFVTRPRRFIINTASLVRKILLIIAEIHTSSWCNKKHESIEKKQTYILKPHDGEYDVGEGGDLLDISNLTDGEVDLDPGSRSQSCSHSRLYVDEELMLFRLRW